MTSSLVGSEMCIRDSLLPLRDRSLKGVYRTVRTYLNSIQARYTFWSPFGFRFPWHWQRLNLFWLWTTLDRELQLKASVNKC
eukprot:9141652-Prorocentrum_lima.AAC.1